MSFGFRAVMLLALVGVAALSASAQQITTPAILNKVGITQNLNAQIPPDLAFRDETGKTVRIGDFFGKKPIVLSLVYFDCPALCTEVLNGELRTMKCHLARSGKGFRGGHRQLRAERYAGARQSEARRLCGPVRPPGSSRITGTF